MSTIQGLLSQQLIERLGWTLIHFVWQAAAMAAILAVTLHVLGRARSNVRYVVACLALGLIVAVPLATMQLIEATPPAGEPGPSPAMDFSAAAPSQRVGAVEVPASPMIDTPPLERVGLTVHLSWRERLTSGLQGALAYLVVGWMIGVFSLSLWHLGGWAQLQRLKRQMVRPMAAAMQTRLAELADRIGVRRTVELLESALVEVPTVVGWIKPVILLPASALTGLIAEQLESLLAHELAHIRRYDYLVNLLQTVVEILGFFHPAVWWVSRKIRVERENCCDDLAVGVYGDSVRYARALASLEEIRHSRTQLAVAADGGALVSRIRRLVGRPTPDDHRFAWLPGLIAMLLVVTLVIPASLALTASGTDRSDSTKTEPPSEDTLVKVDATGSAVSSSDEKALVLLEVMLVKALANAHLDRETAIQVENLLGSGVHLPRQVTVDEVLTTHVVGQSLSQETGRALIDLLKTRAYVEVVFKPEVLTDDGTQTRVRFATEEYFIPPDPSGKGSAGNLDKTEAGTVLNITPQVMDSNKVALEMELIAEQTKALPRLQAPDVPIASRRISGIHITTLDRHYVASVAVGPDDGQSKDDTAGQPLYVMVCPTVIRQLMHGRKMAALGPGDSTTISLRGERHRAAVNDREPPIAGTKPDGEAGLPGQATATTAATEADLQKGLLHLRIDAMEQGHPHSLANPQVYVENDHEARFKVGQEQWLLPPAPMGEQESRSSTERQKIESGIALSITPHIGVNNRITLNITTEVSDLHRPHQSNDLPVVTRSTARNTVTVRDGGTVMAATLTYHRAGQKDEPAREIVVFVTAKRVGDAAAAIPRAP